MKVWEIDASCGNEHATEIRRVPAVAGVTQNWTDVEPPESETLATLPPPEDAWKVSPDTVLTGVTVMAGMPWNHAEG